MRQVSILVDICSERTEYFGNRLPRAGRKIPEAMRHREGENSARGRVNGGGVEARGAAVILGELWALHGRLDVRILSLVSPRAHSGICGTPYGTHFLTYFLTLF